MGVEALIKLLDYILIFLHILLGSLLQHQIKDNLIILFREIIV